MPAEDAPLIDTDLADELFSASHGDEAMEMQREIWSGIRADLPGDLAAIPACTDLRAHLHRIRGYSATCALSALGAFLEEWEKRESDAVAAAASRLPRALELATASITAMESRYPHLASPA